MFLVVQVTPVIFCISAIDDFSAQGTFQSSMSFETGFMVVLTIMLHIPTLNNSTTDAAPGKQMFLITPYMIIFPFVPGIQAGRNFQFTDGTVQLYTANQVVQPIGPVKR